MAPALQIGYHDHCFDGVASAATFLRFYREKIRPGLELAQVGLRGLAHRAGQLFGGDVFAGEENAVVDFRYTPDPRLTWWFDHHQSAFLTAADAEHFRRDTSGRKFYGPEFRSCTKFLAHIGSTKFGFATSDLEELIRLAKSLGNPHAEATTGVDLQVPAIMAYLERHGLRLQGTEIVDIGSWKGEASHPISVRLSPLTIAVTSDPKTTLERFWQERKCLAVWDENA